MPLQKLILRLYSIHLNLFFRVTVIRSACQPTFSECCMPIYPSADVRGRQERALRSGMKTAIPVRSWYPRHSGFLPMLYLPTLRFNSYDCRCRNCLTQGYADDLCRASAASIASAVARPIEGIQ